MSEPSHTPKHSESSFDGGTSGARFTAKEKCLIRQMKRAPRRVEVTDPEFISVLQSTAGWKPSPENLKAITVLETRGRLRVRSAEYDSPKVK